MDASSQFDLAGFERVKHAWQELQDAFAAEGKTRWIAELRPFLAGGSAAPPRQDEVAARLGGRSRLCAHSLRRIRQRYRQSLRNQVARTISDPAEVDEEPAVSVSDPHRVMRLSQCTSRRVLKKQQWESARRAAGSDTTRPKRRVPALLVTSIFRGRRTCSSRPASRQRTTPRQLVTPTSRLKSAATDSRASSSAGARWRLLTARETRS